MRRGPVDMCEGTFERIPLTRRPRPGVLHGTNRGEAYRRLRARAAPAASNVRYPNARQVTLVTIKMREISPTTQPPLFASRNVHKSALLPIDANAEQIFDALRQHLEGDLYWGTRFRTALSVKASTPPAAFAHVRA